VLTGQGPPNKQVTLNPNKSEDSFIAAERQGGFMDILNRLEYFISSYAANFLKP
jgi:hypothetical protein